VDILDSAGQALQRWLNDPDNAAPLSSLQRDLHTLKGGARMAEVEPSAIWPMSWKAFTKAWWIVVTATAKRWAVAAQATRLAQLLEQLQRTSPAPGAGSDRAIRVAPGPAGTPKHRSRPSRQRGA
jgi:chemosensory pili system protein ChpA (sensor histidine kinase/response regulator)